MQIGGVIIMTALAGNVSIGLGKYARTPLTNQMQAGVKYEYLKNGNKQYKILAQAKALAIKL